MDILPFILGSIAAVLLAASLICIIREQMRRKAFVRGENAFELYRRTGMSFVLCYVLLGAFTVILLVGSFLLSSAKDAESPTFLFVVIFLSVAVFSFFSFRANAARLRYGGGVFTVSKIFGAKCSFSLSDIVEVRYGISALKIACKDGTVYKIGNYCVNFELLTAFFNRNAPALKLFSGSADADSFTVCPSVFAQVLLPLLCLALAAGSVCMIVFFHDVAAIIAGSILTVISSAAFLIFLLTAIRWRLTVQKKDIVFTPVFGKTKTYAIRDIQSVTIDGIYSRGFFAGKMIWICLFSGKRITIPYRYAGTQRLLERLKHKLSKEIQI